MDKNNQYDWSTIIADDFLIVSNYNTFFKVAEYFIPHSAEQRFTSSEIICYFHKMLAYMKVNYNSKL